MAVLVVLPKLGQSVESCIISEVHKKKGDTVKKGEILFVYETDKATFEEEATTDGVVLESFFNEGDEVAVLSNMMVIGEPGEDFSSLVENVPVKPAESNEESGSRQTLSASAPEEKGTTPVSTTGINEPTGHENSFVSPRAKKLAAKENINTSSIAGSGPKGRVIEQDVQSSLESRPGMTPLAKKQAAEKGINPLEKGSGLAGTVKSADLAAYSKSTNYSEFEDKKLSNVRKLIAKSMHASLQHSAQLTHHLGADARRILQLRKQIKQMVDDESFTTNITLNDMICFAVIKTLKQYPNVNAHFLGDYTRQFNKVHLGLAVDTDRGLMVPAIRHADDLSIIGLSNQLREVATACRKGNVSPDLLSPEAATFTISNLGNYGVEMFTPVINLPQSAILGVNTILPRPKDLGDGVYGFVPHIGLSLTYDHRALDGGEATRFLKQIATEIETLELDIF